MRIPSENVLICNQSYVFLKVMFIYVDPLTSCYKLMISGNSVETKNSIKCYYDSTFKESN